MIGSQAPTPLAAPASAVLLVGGTEMLAQTCRAVALAGAAASLHRCEVAESLTVAATCRPLIIVVPEDLYEFDTASFDAMARDVQAALLPVPETIHADQLLALFTSALPEIERLRGA